jgi:hypothetical protein
MPGRMTFSVELYIKGAGALPQMVEKIKNPLPLWERIVADWAAGNSEKFAMALGAEVTGSWVDQAAGVFWKGLTPGYMKRKARDFPDQIMVATGNLYTSLTDPSRFFQALSSERIIFGTPLDPDDAAKVSFNWETRQTIFLGEADQRRIQSAVSQYLRIPMQDVRKEIAQMDIEFRDKAGE